MREGAGRRARRLMLAKHAASPQLRGAYRRFIRAARREQESQEHPRSDRASPSRGTKPTHRGAIPAPHRQRLLGGVIILALLPVLLTVFVGIRIYAFYDHVKVAVDTISTASVGDIVHGTAAPGQPSGTADKSDPSAAVPTALPAPRFDRKDPFTILMLGVDTREGDIDSSHSDTIILAYIDPLEKLGHLLSIPRDLRVQQPTGGLAKMADVYANGDAQKYKGVGGVAYVWDTIEKNFQIKIDYYAQVDFNGFKKIVDAVGGVTVDNPYPIVDNAYPTEDYQFTRVFFPAGPMHLYGAEALQFARTRHDDSDFQRNNRQQQVILGVREQALKLNLLAKGTDLIDALKDTVRTDFPHDQWLGLARLGIDLRGDAIKQYSLNNLLGRDTSTGIDYATIDWQQAVAAARDFSPKENFGTIRSGLAPGTNTNVPVVVENGTLNAGLAKRWTTVLQKAGFTRLTATDAPPAVKGKATQTRITYYGPAQQTALALAKLLNIDASRVQDGKEKRPADLPADTAILILLGDDTTDPGDPPPG